MGIGEVPHVDHVDARQVRASLTDPSLFAGIFERHHRRIWSYLARAGGRDCADDLAGEVFVVAFSARHRYDPSRGPVRAWLYGIATNLLRQRSRRAVRADRALARFAAWPTGDTSPLDELVDRDADRARVGSVLAALDALADADREVIVLYAWERLSYEEIAACLRIELGTVRSRLSRARARLRELLAASGELAEAPTTNATREPTDG